MTSCRRCPAAILFVRMRSGKAMPVDPWPDDRGNIAALPTGPKTYTDGRYLAKGESLAEGEVRLMPHWGTCGHNPAGVKGRPRPPEPAPSLF